MDKPIEIEISEWMDEWQDKKIYRGKSIRELFFYHDVPLWWFIRPLIMYPTLKAVVKSIKDGGEPAKPALNKAKIFWVATRSRYKENQRASLGRNSIKKNESYGNKLKICALTITGAWKPYFDPVHGMTRGDSLLGPVLNEIKKKDCQLFCVDVDYTHDLNIKIVKEKIKAGHIPIETYLTKEGRDRASKATKQIKKFWKGLKNELEFMESFVYNNTNIWHYLRHRLDLIFSEYYLYRFVKAIEAMSAMIEKEKPDAILASQETGQYCLAALYLARKLAIPVIGLQHAVIAPTNPDYLSKTSQYGNLDCPVVDKIAVYGTATKKVLVKNGYSSSAVAITGQPRYDILLKEKDLFDKESFCGKYGVDPKKKIFVLMTQVLGSEEERSAFLRNMLRVLKKFPELQIVVKPKALEEWHKQVVKEESASAIVLPAPLNAFEPLFVCDYMATVSSTTALEAMMFNKPVLIVNLTGRSEADQYVESGATAFALKADEIEPAIRKLLNDKKFVNDLAKRAKRFVLEQAYKIDGKASSRVADLVYREALKARLKRRSSSISK